MHIHKWSKWVIVKTSRYPEVNMKYPEQRRECIKCGKTQQEYVMPSWF